MTITLSEQTKDQAILEAIRLAGPGASDEAVAAELRRIAGYLDAGSALRYEFDKIEKRAESTEKVKTFLATVIGVDKEVTSNRGVVYLRSQPSQYHPDGKEFVRSERLEDAAARELMNKARGLIGHKVRVAAAVETTGKVKVRVVRSLTDEGVDTAFDANHEDYQPSMAKLDKSKLASQGATA